MCATSKSQQPQHQGRSFAVSSPIQSPNLPERIAGVDDKETTAQHEEQVRASNPQIPTAGVQIEEEGEDTIPTGDEIAIELEKKMNPDVDHFVVQVGGDDPNTPTDIVGLDIELGDVDSMTRLFTLPSLVPQLNHRQRDPALKFSKSLILTSDEYVAAVEQRSQAKVHAAEKRERSRALKEEQWKVKEAERQEEKRLRAEKAL